MGLDLVIVCQEKIHIWDLEPIFIELLENMGIENFRKDILRVCKTREDAEDLEACIVNKDLIINPMCYNIVRGGCKYNWYDSVIVKDKLGNHTIVNKDDPRYINGDLVPITKGNITVLDLDIDEYVSNGFIKGYGPRKW